MSTTTDSPSLRTIAIFCRASAGAKLRNNALGMMPGSKSLTGLEVHGWTCPMESKQRPSVVGSWAVEYLSTYLGTYLGTSVAKLCLFSFRPQIPNHTVCKPLRQISS